jgi:CelD/BcsL family acetyltransferase involved in cellulose biosynthesis
MIPESVLVQRNMPANLENAKQIIRLNRATIESKGKRYGVDRQYENDILAACAITGIDISLFVGSKLIGGAIFCVCGKSAFLQTVGYDGAFARYSPGLVCLHEAVKIFDEIGLSEVNFLWGGYNYKERVGGKRETLFTYTFVRNARAMLFPMHVVRAVNLAILLPASSRVKSVMRPVVRVIRENTLFRRKSEVRAGGAL